MVGLLLEHPAVAVTASILAVADTAGHASVITLLLSTGLQSMTRLCRMEVRCRVDGPLLYELKKWERRSAFTMLLALKRTQSSQVAARLSDVLRDVFQFYTRFYVVEVEAL
jgi:hypothetical protein